MEPIRFEAELLPVPGEPTATYLIVPPEVAAGLGGRARIAIAAVIAGQPYRGSTMPAGGGGHHLGVTKAIREAAGVRVGDRVTVQIARDDAPRDVPLPRDLAAVLEAEQLMAAFEAQSYTARKEQARAVEEAKRPETRVRRIERIVANLRRQGGVGSAAG